jgi:hypothetical protein
MTFQWPKMHSLLHLVPSIRGKGPIINSSTDGGEALHPDSKKYWIRSNKQAETLQEQVSPLAALVRAANLILHIRCCAWLSSER